MQNTPHSHSKNSNNSNNSGKNASTSEDDDDTQFLFGAVNVALKGGDSSRPPTPHTPAATGNKSNKEHSILLNLILFNPI